LFEANPSLRGGTASGLGSDVGLPELSAESALVEDGPAKEKPSATKNASRIGLRRQQGSWGSSIFATNMITSWISM